MWVYILQPSSEAIASSRTHKDAPQSVGLLWTSDQSVAETSDNTQHSQQTNVHAPGWIRTHDRSRRAAADPRLRPRGYWDRLSRKVNNPRMLSERFRTLNSDSISQKPHLLSLLHSFSSSSWFKSNCNAAFGSPCVCESAWPVRSRGSSITTTKCQLPCPLTLHYFVRANCSHKYFAPPYLNPMKLGQLPSILLVGISFNSESMKVVPCTRRPHFMYTSFFLKQDTTNTTQSACITGTGSGYVDCSVQCIYIIGCWIHQVQVRLKLSLSFSLQGPVVTLHTAWFNVKQFYVLPTRCSCVWIWEQTAIISLYSINWLVFIAETECVYCAVRTGSYNSGYVFCVDLRTNSDYFPIQH